MFQFGRMDDLLLFWLRDLEEKKYSGVVENESIRQQLDRGFPEYILLTDYLKKLDLFGGESIESYWRSTASNFMVVDPSSLDQYWFKYDRFVEHKNRSYNERRLNEIFSFMDWLILVASVDYPVPDLEKVQSRTVGTRLQVDDFTRSSRSG